MARSPREAVLGEKLLDVGNRQLVSELASQMAASAEDDLGMPDDVSGYEQMALLLAHALVSHKTAGDDARRDGGEHARRARHRRPAHGRPATSTAGAASCWWSRGSPTARADDREGAGSIVSTLLVGARRAAATASYWPGPVASSAEDGLVGTVRADPTTADVVSTVDAVERTAGAVVAVLALREEADGKSGHYGTSAAPDGALPGQRQGLTSLDRRGLPEPGESLLA